MNKHLAELLAVGYWLLLIGFTAAILIDDRKKAQLRQKEGRDEFKRFA